MLSLLVLVLGGAPASPVPALEVPETGASASEFAPKGWQVESSVEGELNGDARADLLVVLLQDGEVDRARALVWLHGEAKGFRLVDVNSTLLACFECLGVKGGTAAPQISIAKRVVSISQSGGSRDAYGSTHRFRFDGKEVKLIGLDRTTMDTLTGAGTSISRNFLTGVTVAQTTPAQTDDNGKPTGQKPTKKTSKAKPAALVRLADVTDGAP